jgi:serine/threonine protein kinase
MRLINNKSGFGIVYEAFERGVPKLLKVLKPEYGNNSKAVDLFRQEALVLSQLAHPSVPAIESDGYFQYFPHGSHDPLHCLMMEKIDGLNLREWMRQQGHNPIGEKQALNWLKQLVEVLHLVHQKNYFHRDIKPENIMLRSTGQIVLVDFGTAREMTFTYLEQVGKTGGITRISSAGYTPPEQEKGQAVPQSDFYALGCTLIYLLTGSQPTDIGMYDYFNNELTWRKYAPNLSPAFADFIDRLVANRVCDRPQDTQEILDTLPKLAIGVAEQLHPTQLTPSTIVRRINKETVRQGEVIQKAGKPWWLGGAIALTILMIGGYGLKQTYYAQFFSNHRTEKISGFRELKGHTSFVNCLALSPDGKTLVSGSADSSIRLWNFETGKPLQTLMGHTGYINAIAITPDGKTLVSGSSETTIKLWDLASRKELKTLQGHQGYINALDISPDGKILASGSADKTVRLWDLTTGTAIRTLMGHKDFVNGVVFSPNGRSLFSGGVDNIIQQWEVDTGKNVRTFKGHTSFVNALAVSPDGSTLISSSADKTIKIWDLDNAAAPRTLTKQNGVINAIVLKPDGKTLISGGGDQTLKIWDLETGQVKQTLTGYEEEINYFVVSLEGAIATGSGSKTIRIWQIKQ